MTLRSRPLIVFDLDGTVTDSLPATFTCFAEAVAPFLGRRPSRDEILARMGAADQHIIGDWVGPAHAAAAVRRLYDCYAREFARLAAFPGIVELIRDLRACGRRTALFTGRGRPSTGVMLAALGIAPLFEFSVTGEEAGRPKPSPDGLRLILERSGHAATEAVYVGDSPLDVEAARAAGVVPVAALWGTHQREDLERLKGVVFAETVGDLRRLLLAE